MSSVGQTISSWGSSAISATVSAGKTVGHAIYVGGSKGYEGVVYYGGIALEKLSALSVVIKENAATGYAAAKPKAIALANSAQANFVVFNAEAVAKVGVIFDSITKASPAAVAPYTGYAVLGGTAIVSGIIAGHLLKNTSWKITGIAVALFSTVTTASTIGFVAGPAVPVAAAYAIGVAVPVFNYYMTKRPPQ